MSLVAQLEAWRHQMIENRVDEPPPTDDEVLGQFLYSALSDLVEKPDESPDWDALATVLATGGDYERWLNDWVDRYGADDAAVA